MPLSVKMVVLAPHLIQTCALMATNQRLEYFVADETYSELMVSLLDILIILSGQQAFQEIFIHNKAKLLVSICMNMIKTGESEATLILSDPQEFVNLAIDCCDKQKSMTVKT